MFKTSYELVMFIQNSTCTIKIGLVFARPILNVLPIPRHRTVAKYLLKMWMWIQQRLEQVNISRHVSRVTYQVSHVMTCPVSCELSVIMVTDSQQPDLSWRGVSEQVCVRP